MNDIDKGTAVRPFVESQIVLTREQLPTLTGRDLSNVQLLRLEAAGRFPRRFYLTPKTPVWSVEEIKAHIEQVKQNREVRPAISNKKQHPELGERKHVSSKIPI